MSDNPNRIPPGPLRRFLVFTGSAYYASGGALDLRGSHDTLEAAIHWLTHQPRHADYADYSDGFNWCHVLDCQTGLIVAYNEGVNGGSIDPRCDWVLLSPDATNLRTGDNSD